MKKLLRILSLMIPAGLFFSCSESVPPPAPYGAIPTEYQIDWQKMEYYMFIHFGPNTFTDVEWGDGKENPRVFNPTDPDCRQWASIAKEAGMKAIIITAKHHDGFCLWPSNYSTHTVRESPWKDGKGDLLKELSEACKEYGLKFGVYLSPWEQNHPDYGTPAYNQVFANTLTEVLTGYGHVFEQWFDGANGEGPNGKKQEYDWDLFHKTVFTCQPHAIVFSDIGPGCRWMGNERGIAGKTNWSTLNVAGFGRGHGAPKQEALNTGNMNGEAWVPAETDVSIRPGWFYSPRTDDKVKSLEHLVDIYHTSIGRNSNLLLNVPPDRRGRIHPNDSARLMDFRKAIDESYTDNLMKGAIVTADNTRGNSPKYAPGNLIDEDYESYWSADDNRTSAFIEIDLGKPQTFNRFLIQEYIPLGQRVVSFSLQRWDDDSSTWVPLQEATTIGYKRILRLPQTTTQKLLLHIDEALACPVLNNIELYLSPEYGHNPKGSNEVQATIVENMAPQTVIMEEVKTLKGFYYIPSPDNTASNLMRYNLYASEDGETWCKLIDNGLFNNIRNNPIRQEIMFDEPIRARCLKLEPIETTTGDKSYATRGFGGI